MSNEWRNSTTIQVKASRREELDELRARLTGQRGRLMELREVVDEVLEAGIAALQMEEAHEDPRADRPEMEEAPGKDVEQEEEAL